MNNYSILAGNESQEALDAMWMVHSMYHKFLTSKGYLMQPARPSSRTVRGYGGGAPMVRMDIIEFETNADLDEVCGRYRYCRISPYDTQGRRHTNYVLLCRSGSNPKDFNYSPVVSIILNPYQRVWWKKEGEKSLHFEENSLDIRGDDVIKVLRGEEMPWLTLKEQ